MWKFERRWIIYFVIILLVLGVDQGAKYLVVSNLQLGQSWEFCSAVSGFLKIQRSYNTGAAFGMFPSGSNVFLFVGLISLGVFSYFFYELPESAKMTMIGIGMILGGAISNALDRIRFDHVIDYVYVQVGPQYANISNFADHFVTIGTILFLIEQWFIMENMENITEKETKELAE